MKAYYAHCLQLYGTIQETRDVILLSSLGFEVVNPNNTEVQEACKKFEAKKENPMEYFRRFVRECDLIAFRSLYDGRIPSGVALEVSWFQEANKPVIELPSGIKSRSLMTYEQTVEYLCEIGQR
jgi:hypothetical protein